MIKVKNINGSPESVPSDVKIYGTHSDSEFFYFCTTQEEADQYKIEPTTEPISREVANWKLKAILDSMGLLPNISAAINSLQEPNKTFASYAWEYSQTVDQYSPTVKLIQAACNLTDEQVNTIFNQAEAINI